MIGAIIRHRWARLLPLGVLINLVAFFAALGLLDMIFPFPAGRIAEARSGGSSLVLDREGGLVAWRADSAGNWRMPVGLEQMSPWLVQATLAAEDKRFFSHNGVDPFATLRAIRQDAVNMRRVSGASTITMQCVRLLFPRERTWWAKAVESCRALQLERIASKEEILELYFNLAPYGGNVVGVEAASRRFFAKPAAELTLGEAALLAGLPQSPARFNPAMHLEAALARRNFVLARILYLGLVREGVVEIALREPIRLAAPARSANSPCLAEYLFSRGKQGGQALRSTISPKAQCIATQAVSGRFADLRTGGVDGVAVVVIDVAGSSLAAMVGNPEEENQAHGQVNGAVSRRQPGSLLKPFIYALAYERGLLTPNSMVDDSPKSWGSYKPENMDKRFLGPVQAGQALRLSRNIPAVAALDRMGLQPFAEKLGLLGLKLAYSPEHYGLSLALGTAELRLIDIANAYAALARMGNYSSLQEFGDGNAPARHQAYTAGAAWLALRSLGAAESGATPKAVWKTGTSWNQRDAWAVSLSPRYVVAVWCGGNSGVGKGGLTGSSTALPLALEITAQLRDGSERSWFRPAGVSARKCCAESGAAASINCQKIGEGEYLPGISDEKPCSLHAAGGPALASGQGEAKNAAKQAMAKAYSPAIISPRAECEYLLDPANRTQCGNSLSFQANAESGELVYWYVDGTLVGETKGREALPWIMQLGEHELIMASSGQASACLSFKVARAPESPRLSLVP